MNIIESINRDGQQVQAIPGVVDLAYGEDDRGPHALVFVEDTDRIAWVLGELSRQSLLSGCRVVIQPELRLH